MRHDRKNRHRRGPGWLRRLGRGPGRTATGTATATTERQDQDVRQALEPMPRRKYPGAECPAVAANVGPGWPRLHGSWEEMDALNGIAWADDGQVVRAVTAKSPPGGPPRTEITVYRVGPYPRPTRGGVCESCGGPTSRKTVRRCRTCRTRATPPPGGGAGGGVGGLA